MFWMLSPKGMNTARSNAILGCFVMCPLFGKLLSHGEANSGGDSEGEEQFDAKPNKLAIMWPTHLFHLLPLVAVPLH